MEIEKVELIHIWHNEGKNFYPQELIPTKDGTVWEMVSGNSECKVCLLYSDIEMYPELFRITYKHIGKDDFMIWLEHEKESYEKSIEYLKQCDNYKGLYVKGIKLDYINWVIKHYKELKRL